jgi:hypothetical protein
MIVSRCGSGLAFALLLASCAGQVDTSKYALPERDASAPPVRFSRADINPDGTLVDPYSVRAPRGSGKKYASKERDRSQSDARQDGNGATSDIARHAMKTGLSSRQSDDPTTAGTPSDRSQAQFQKGSDRWKKEEADRWKKEQAENEKLDKQLNEQLQSICTKC